MGRKILLDGQIKFIDCVNIKLDSPALNYGLGLFETILYENNKIFFLDEHIERMKSSCTALNLPLPDIDLMNEASILDLILNSNIQNSVCRIKIIYAPLFKKNEWNVIIMTSEYIRNTAPVIVSVESKTRENSFYKHKSVSYMQNFLLSDDKPGSETLFLNSKRNIIEGTKSNILCLKEGILYFVDQQENYLSGIMQKNILSDYKNFGVDAVSFVQYGFSIDLLKQCSEVILTNSLMPAVSISQIRYKNVELSFSGIDLSNKIRNYYLK